MDNRHSHGLEFLLGILVVEHIFNVFMSSPQTAEIGRAKAQSQEQHYYDREFALIEEHYANG